MASSTAAESDPSLVETPKPEEKGAASAPVPEFEKKGSKAQPIDQEKEEFESTMRLAKV
jgi:hypothetical protein